MPLASLALVAGLLAGAIVPSAAVAADAVPPAPMDATTSAAVAGTATAVDAPDSAIVPPTRTGTTSYVSGTSIAWLAENPGPVTGVFPATDPLGGSITAMAGGGIGLVGIGSDSTSGVGAQAASWTSADGGASWEKHVVPEAGSGFSGLVARGGVFVTTSERGVFLSRDGVSWAPAVSGPPGRAELGIGLGGLLASTTSASGRLTHLWRSADGSHWTALPTPAVLRSVCWPDLEATSSRMVALAFTCGTSPRPRILVSTNARTWSFAAVPSGLRDATLASAGGRFLLFGGYTVGGRHGTAVWSSTTGTAWRRTSSVALARPYTSEFLRNVVRFGPGYVTAGLIGDGTADDCWPVVWSSPDLVHWKRTFLPNAPYWGTCAGASHVSATSTRLLVTGYGWDMGGDGLIAWIGTLMP